jgi:hypothetical protein
MVQPRLPGNRDIVGELCQEPNDLTFAQVAARVIHTLSVPQQRIEHLSRFSIL